MGGRRADDIKSLRQTYEIAPERLPSYVLKEENNCLFGRNPK